MYFIFIAVLVLVVIAWFMFKPKKITPVLFDIDEDKFLDDNVKFYSKLSSQEKSRFLEKVHFFFSRVKITGIKTEVSEEDKLLIAAAATIPIFRFNNWFYNNLTEVILYPNHFDANYSLDTNNPIRGMVGNRHLNNTVLLSRKALHLGFDNKTDKNNTGIHEFVHLLDMDDGIADGVPEVLMDKKAVIPWVDLMYKEIQNIEVGKSSLRAYGATNEAEFFSVAAEYFFERPELLKRKHPELYAALQRKFGVNEKAV